MNKSEILALRTAEPLLAYLRASYPPLAGPYKMNSDPEDRRSVETVAIPSRIFSIFLEKQIVVEGNLAESGNDIDLSGFSYGPVFVSDNDGHVSCIECAIVDDDEVGRFAFEVRDPVVFGLIGGDAERSLADRVRVITYLVRGFSQFVGCGGGIVGFLSEGVRVLSDLVRSMRLAYADGTGDKTSDARETAHTSDDSPHKIPIHENQSNAQEPEK